MTTMQKIAEIESEMARTQKNKATAYHLGLLKAKLAKLKEEIINPKSGGGGKPGEGFDVTKSGDARVGLIGFPSVGKSTLLTKLTGTESAVAAYEFTTLTCLAEDTEVLTDRGFMTRAEVFAACPELAPSSPTAAPASDNVVLPFCGAVCTRTVNPLYWTPSAAEEKADEAAGIRHEQLTGPMSASAVQLRDAAGRYGHQCGLCGRRVWSVSEGGAGTQMHQHNTSAHPAEVAAASRTGGPASVTSAASASSTSGLSSSSPSSSSSSPSSSPRLSATSVDDEGDQWAEPRPVLRRLRRMSDSSVAVSTHAVGEDVKMDDDGIPVPPSRPPLARSASMPVGQVAAAGPAHPPSPSPPAHPPSPSSPAHPPSPLLFASLDPSTGHLVYLPATAITYKLVSSLVEFTHAAEAPSWKEDADEYGLTPDEQRRMKERSDRARAGEVLEEEDRHRVEHLSNGVSLLVDRQHDMYVRVGVADTRSAGDKHNTTWADDYVKVKAGSLVSDSSRQRVRMTGQATAGSDASAVSDDQLPFIAALRLSNTAEIDTFLWLYGYWCGDGYLTSQLYHRAVVFTPKKDEDKKEVKKRLEALAFTVPSASVHVYDNADGGRTFEVTDKRWVDYFFGEYGPKYGAASVSSSRTHTHTGLTTPLPRSVKWSAQQPLQQTRCPALLVITCSLYRGSALCPAGSGCGCGVYGRLVLVSCWLASASPTARRPQTGT